MFVREKRIGAYTYIYLVESVREGGRTKQRIIKNLGRKEAVAARGELDRLARSAARLAQRSMILSLVGGGTVPDLSCLRIGAPLLFERLWRDTECRAVVAELAAGRKFEFAVERAVFLTVLHRLTVSGSDRSCEAWRADYRIDGVAGLALHHLYRAMAWLGEELGDDDRGAATPLAPRCVKDLVEEALFARRRDLFSDLSVVFMDTTSLYFEGAGGETLGRRGFSKDHRPDLKQMIVAVVIDQNGRPVCSEMWPGNTADVTTLIPVLDRLRKRFGIARVCVVADRGMISAATIGALEERRLEYVLGVRERSTKEVREVVLADEAPMVSEGRFARSRRMRESNLLVGLDQDISLIPLIFSGPIAFGSTGHGGPPDPFGRAPVDTLDQYRQLFGGQRHRVARLVRAGPGEAPFLQPLGEQA